MSNERLIRIEAKHFVAGIVMTDGRCTKAAPILKWAIGKSEEWLRAYFVDKGWKATEVKTHDRG